MIKKIDRFVGEHAFLSNFYPSSIWIDGRQYQTCEHAYQASKTLVDSEHEVIRGAKTAGEAKKLGRSVNLRRDWESVKVDLMRKFVRLKFENPLLRELLLATGDAELIEGNHWNDTCWGVCRGTGQNWLGKILQEVREGITVETLTDSTVQRAELE